MEIVMDQAYVITGGQLVSLARMIAEEISKDKPSELPKTRYIRGLDTLAVELGVSKDTVVRHKRLGTFGDAISQNGRIIEINLELAKKRFFEKQKSKNRRV